MYKSQCVPERLQQAVDKLAMVTEYLDLSDMHHDGDMANLRGVVLVLVDIREDLEFVDQQTARATRTVSYAR